MRHMLAVMMVLAVGTVRADDPKPDAAKSDPATTEIVRKAIAAHGGKETLEKYSAMQAKITGSMNMFGIDIDYTGEVHSMLPSQVRVTMNANMSGTEMSVVQIVNGNKTKSTTNGATNPDGQIEAAEIRQLAFIQEISMITPLLTPKYTLKSEKDELVGDTETAVISVSAEGMKEMKLYFDKKTGLFVKTSRMATDPTSGKPVEVLEETVMSDFQTFNGVKTPTKSTVTRNGKKFMSMTTSEVKFMEKADPKLFALDD